MNTLKKPLTALGLAILAAGAVAYPATGDQATGPAAGPGTPSAHSSAGTSRVPQARRAVRTAQRAVGAGRAFDLEWDRHRGARVWEVEVDSGSARPIEVKVTRNGRRVLRRHRTSRSDDVRKARQARINLVGALNRANRHGDGALIDADIDRDRGQLVWDVTFRRGRVDTEVKINARNGRLVRIDRETGN